MNGKVSQKVMFPRNNYAPLSEKSAQAKKT